MEIITAAEMSAADRRTAEQFGVPVATLMENAGAAVARFCLRRCNAAQAVVVLCGKGNNGGDGMVAARVMAGQGVGVRVVLLGRAEELKGEAAAALERLRTESAGVPIDMVEDEAGLRALGSMLAEAELIVDAVVGTGFQPPLRGLAAELREMVEALSAPVVTVDVPSGWDADAMDLAAEGAFRSNAVVTFTRPKLGHIFGHMTLGTFGPVVLAEIGSPGEAVVSETKLHWTGVSKAVTEEMRGLDSNKGRFGHVLVVGGSYGTAGAAAMASLAALRAGAGLVTAAVPKSIVELVAGVAPELMLTALREGEEGAVSLANLDAGGLPELLKTKRIGVVALGPGMSTRGDAARFARELTASCKVAMVVDADALNAFEGRAAELKGAGRVLVLTPHPGEMARLTGLTVQAVEADRIGVARRFAMEHAVTLVLKGWRTLVAHPNGRIGVNTTGNPAMAKGGSGDILTGIVAAMLAQYAASGEPEEVARAVEAAVLLHGLAGDFAARAMEEHTVLATDTLAHLSDAFRYRLKDMDELIWICGVNR